jgi:hypothetical protein
MSLRAIPEMSDQPKSASGELVELHSLVKINDELRQQLADERERFRLQQKNYIDLCDAILGTGTRVDNDPFVAVRQLRGQLERLMAENREMRGHKES